MMNLEQLIGRHLRLREELAKAGSMVPWNHGHVDRITAELAAVEADIAGLQGRANADDGPDASTYRFPFFPLHTGERAG